MADRRQPTVVPPRYLAPYARAADRHGGAFAALLWSSRRAQLVRFDALLRAASLAGLDVGGAALLDAGCGRADWLDFLAARRVRPARYVGVEGVAALADAARAKVADARFDARIVADDFVTRPACLDAGADVIAFSGSLNTLSADEFCAALAAAAAVARRGVVFNFLDSPARAANDYLTWHDPAGVLALARALAGPAAAVVHLRDYLDGDATVALATGA